MNYVKKNIDFQKFLKFLNLAVHFQDTLEAVLSIFRNHTVRKREPNCLHTCTSYMLYITSSAHIPISFYHTPVCMIKNIWTGLVTHNDLLAAGFILINRIYYVNENGSRILFRAL